MAAERAEPILPVCLLFRGRRCLVVGAGAVAARKVGTLLEADAVVRIVAPEAVPAIREQAAAGVVEWRRRCFDPDDLDGCALAIAATDEPAVNDTVLAACRARGVLGSRVDAAWREGDFISPATVREGGTTVAVSTGGHDPRLLKRLAARLRELLRADRSSGDQP